MNFFRRQTYLFRSDEIVDGEIKELLKLLDSLLREAELRGATFYPWARVARRVIKEAGLR